MTNGFTVRKVKTTQTLGEKLEEARKRVHLSLDELSKKINVQKKYLESLEQGKYSELPADVYVKGYLKNLTEYLELNFSEVLSLYQRERGIEKNIKNFTKKKKKERLFSITITPRFVRIGAGVFVFLTVISYLWYQISGLARPPELAVWEPSQDKTISEDVITVRGQTEPGVALTINDQPVYIDSEGNFKESVGLQQGLNVLKIAATNRFEKQSVVVRKIMSEAKTSQNLDEDSENSKQERQVLNKEESSKPDKLELKILIKDKATWLHVEEDGKVAYSGTMLPDSSLTFSARDRITLSSGKANTTYVIFNGKDLGALGETGEVIREMEFTKDLILAD